MSGLGRLGHDADSRTEYRYFLDCYHAGLKARAGFVATAEAM